MLSRRRLLAAGGLAAATLSAGYAVADSQTSVPADPDGWPMARHDPGGTSYAPEATPPRDGVTVRWKQSFEANDGFAWPVTPIVSGGRVYALGREILVLDADSGAVRFRADLDQSATATPALAPASAYRTPTLALSRDGGVRGLGANGGFAIGGFRTGLERWRHAVTDRGFDLFGSQAVRRPPVAADGTVVSMTAQDLVALDASSGAVRWQRASDTPRPAVRDGTVYTTIYGEGVRGYDLASGDVTFEVTLPEQVVYGVTAGPDQLVVGRRDGLVGISYDGDVNWQYAPSDGWRSMGGIALADGVAYTGFDVTEGDRLVAVDATDGTERWRSEAAPEQEPRFAPPAIANDTVYVPQDDRTLSAVDATDGSVRWTIDGENELRLWSPVAIAGDRLYATDGDHVYALEAP